MVKTDASFEDQVFRTHSLIAGDGGPTRLRARAVRQSDTGSHFEGDFSVLENGVTTTRFHGRFRLVNTEIEEERDTDQNEADQPEHAADGGECAGGGGAGGEGAAEDARSRPEALPLVVGDVVDAGEDYILNFCDCTGVATPNKGLAGQLLAKFPDADVYRARREDGRAADALGSISLHGRVVNLFVESVAGSPESPTERLRSFRQCLQALRDRLPDDTKSLAVAAERSNEDWPLYLRELQTFAMQSRMRVVVYEHIGLTGQ